MNRSPRRRRQKSNGSNGSVTIVNINSRSRIKQLSAGSANSGRNMGGFWNGIDEVEHQEAQAKKTNIKVPSRRRHTKQASFSSEVSARVHDDLPFIDDAQQQRQFKNKGQKKEEEKETAVAVAVDPIVEPPGASHCDKKRTSRPLWKFLSLRKRR